MRKRLRWMILVTAVLLIVVGLWRGEIEPVMQKAILICLECIGIG